MRPATVPSAYVYRKAFLPSFRVSRTTKGLSFVLNTTASEMTFEPLPA